jgi:polyhydroxyalkanoate synthesis regulator phasin
MNKIKRLLLNQAPISIVSLALAATISISAISIDANADDQMSDSKETVVTSNETMSLLKITDALIAGTITAEEAAKKIQSANRIDMYLTKIETEISDEVANGTLTVEEGIAKYDSAVLRINKRMNGGEKNSNDRMESYLKKVGTELRDAVASGEITAEEGREKYAEAEAKIQQRMGNNKGNSTDRSQVYLTKIGTGLCQSVANGEMTPEDAKAKYLEAVEQMKQRMASKNDANKDGAGRGGNRGKGGNSSGRGK